MSLLFWKKRGGNPEHPDDETAVAVSEQEPLPARLVATDEDEDNPFPFKVANLWLPPVAGQTITRRVKVPGIGTGSAYAAGDAFGTMITLPDVFRAEKCSGTVVSVVFHDLDDEGALMDVPLFTRSFTVTADNSAFAPSDDDNLNCAGVVSITDFKNWGNNQIGQALSVGLWINGTSPHLYTQLVTNGTPNIAAGAEPWLDITIIPD